MPINIPARDVGEIFGDGGEARRNSGWGERAKTRGGLA